MAKKSKIVEDEELNLQDLIFILLFFFIIAQTLIVFKLQKDVIVPQKTSDEIKTTQKKDNPELITVIIDEQSNVFTLIKHFGRASVIEGFEGMPVEKLDIYIDPSAGKDQFLESEEKDANQTIYERLIEIRDSVGFTKPKLGLIADHRARYGAIFQVNRAVTELIKKEAIDANVQWKMQPEGQAVPQNVEGVPEE